MKILCCGDSNTWGYDPRTPLGEQYDEIWPDLLRKNKEWQVINSGENGQEIRNASSWVPSDIDLLIVMLGTNDLLQGRQPETISRDMEQFLRTLKLPRDKILLIAPVPMCLGQWVTDHKLLSASRQLTEYYRKLANEQCIRFVDAGQWGIPLAFDGVHFTEEGHRVFCQKLLAVLSSNKEMF